MSSETTDLQAPPERIRRRERALLALAISKLEPTEREDDLLAIEDGAHCGAGRSLKERGRTRHSGEPPTRRCRSGNGLRSTGQGRQLVLSGIHPITGHT
jgi:hypothetical protein